MRIHKILLLVLLPFLGCKTSDETASSVKADPAIDKLRLLPGFAAEHLYSPSAHRQGSWVALTFDDKGRMITSDQYGYLYRVTLPGPGEKGAIKVDTIHMENRQPGRKSLIDIGYAHGLLYAFNSLYVVVNHWPDSTFDKGSGLYQLKDTDGNDRFDKITLLKKLEGGGEHGPHSLKLAPDKKSIYIVSGNFTRVPEMNRSRLPGALKDDNLFPLIKDPRGHDNPPVLPAGWIARFSPDGSYWELVAGGLRNTFDITFNHEGELFAYDSDMEWDLGLPWYRPTRIYHVTSGSDFGWRIGTGKWPSEYPDAVPPMLNIGQGSPTNFTNGMNSNFPEKYRKALFASDWSFGIIYAIFPEADGASYKATAEEFLSGAPLPLTDGEFGPDGAFYFLTGGRTLQSDLYRVYYRDAKPMQPLAFDSARINPKAMARKKLERYHARTEAGAVDVIWPYLSDNDRAIRYSARVALEHQPLLRWQERVLAEKNPVTLSAAAIAVAHNGATTLRDQVLRQLAAVDFARLTLAEQIDQLRAVELVMIRLGKPTAPVAELLFRKLDPFYPSKNNAFNRALAKVLLELDASKVLDRTLALMETAQDDTDEVSVVASSDLIMRNAQYGLDIARVLANLPPREQVYNAVLLSKVNSGWTKNQRDRYFRWYAKAFTFKGGNSYVGFLNGARRIALENVDMSERAHYDSLSGGHLLTGSGNDLANLPRPKGPYRNWKLEEAVKVLDSGLVNRDFENGRNMFAAVLCKSCHQMRGEGGSMGPDLTQLGTRFSTQDMLVHIMEPDKEVSDQYAPHLFQLRNGKSMLGKLVNEDAEKFYISQNPFSPEVISEIPRANVASWRKAPISLMPSGLINQLNGEELKDLIAYLVAGGDLKHEKFRKE